MRPILNSLHISQKQATRAFVAAQIMAIGLLVAFELTGCAYRDSEGKERLITVSFPKTYSDDRVLKMLDERKKALNEVVKSVQEKELQEISGVREATKTTIVIKGQATADTVVSAPDAVASPDITLPTAPAASDKLGLPFQSLLKKIALRDQLITGLQLLYAGDDDVLDSNRRLVLVRFDVSINDYIDGKSSFLQDTKFLTVGFKLRLPEDQPVLFMERQSATLRKDKPVTPPKPVTPEKSKTDNPGRFRVYALMPDYSSIVTMDSFVNSQIDRLAAQAAGKTGTTALQGAFDRQRALEESLLSVIEQPMEFGIYGSEPDTFGFAFGPRRRVEKRSWINPAGWFGNRYKINYEIEPGPRDVYALITLPCSNEGMGVDVTINNEPQTGKFYEVLDSTKQTAAMKISFLSFSMSYDLGCAKPTINEVKDKISNLLVEPTVFYPKQANSLLLISNSPVSTESEVWLNHVLIPREQISVMGRYRLKVTVPANDSLKALLKEKNPSITVRLVTPGTSTQAASPFFAGIELKDSEPIEPDYSLEPTQGAAGTDLKFMSKNSKIDFSKTKSVSVGGLSADIITDQKKANQVIFRAPKPANDTVDHPVSVELLVDVAGKDERIYLNNKFTYLGPKKP